MVAKSFQQLKIDGKPFFENNKWYVNVINKSGGLRKVRWYTNEDEYYKAFPDQRPALTFDAKKAFGFDNGYIVIFSGAVRQNDAWFRACPVTQYANHFGWFVKSTSKFPDDVPDGVFCTVLSWDAIANKTDEEIKNLVMEMTHVYDRYGEGAVYDE